MVHILDGGGYDGQKYFYVANHLFKKETTKPFSFQLYRKILFPFLQYLISFGNPKLIIYISPLLNIALLLFAQIIFLKILDFYKINPIWSVSLVFLPGVVQALKFNLTDILLMFGFLTTMYFYINKKYICLFMALTISFFAREQIFLIYFAILIALSIKKEYKLTSILATSILPYIGWLTYCKLFIFPSQSVKAGSKVIISTIPLKGIYNFFCHICERITI